MCNCVSLNEIMSEVNQILGRAMPTEINIIKHDNLNRRSFFVDKKHFKKAAEGPPLAKNIKHSINNTGAYKRNTGFQRKKKYGDTRPRARGPADNNHSKPAGMNFSGKCNVSQSAENPGHNSSSEVFTCLNEVMKQSQLMNNNFMSIMPNPREFNFNPHFGHFQMPRG